MWKPFEPGVFALLGRPSHWVEESACNELRPNGGVRSRETPIWRSTPVLRAMREPQPATAAFRPTFSLYLTPSIMAAKLSMLGLVRPRNLRALVRQVGRSPGAPRRDTYQQEQRLIEDVT